MEIMIGIVSALFFAVTFILNRAMELDGGSWLWSASLRYFFMLPFLIVIVAMREGLRPLCQEMSQQPRAWLGFSFIGFVLFYAPLTFAAGYGEGWLVSGTWQLTIIAGILLAPLFTTIHNGIVLRENIPRASLVISSIIMIGIVLIQLPQMNEVSGTTLLLSFVPVVIAAVAYPLGNRKMMQVCSEDIDAFQRLLGMTVASLPAWIIMAGYALFTVGLPSSSQLVQSLVVALSSGVIATTLFFIATNRVKHHQGKLAAVEATQSTEIIFVIIGEMLLLQIALPSTLAFIGIGIIMGGMLLHSYYTALLNKKTALSIVRDD